MSPERYQRLRELFDQAIDRPPEQRVSYVEQACPDDEEARQTVLRLLDSHRRAESLLQTGGVSPVRRIGRYLVLGEVGRGAMGVVYQAFDPVIDRTVAIKTIRLESDDRPESCGLLCEQLLNEARSAGKLSHPGVVTIYDVGQENDNVAFIAMEFVEGQSLQKIVASGKRFGPAEVIAILRQVAAALDYSHTNLIVHRDIKPANILLQQTSIVKVTDFGIAGASTGGTTFGSAPTSAGAVMGTPIYMSPEQINSAPVDGRSDQFSLAVVAYQLLTSSHPFTAHNLQSLFHRILTQPPPLVAAADPALPNALDAVFARGLAKQPANRYPTCAQFVEELCRAFDPEQAAIVLAESQRAEAKPEIRQPRTRLRGWLTVIVIPSFVITFLLRVFFSLSPVTRDRPLTFFETTFVAVAVIVIVATVRYLMAVAARQAKKLGAGGRSK